jgi:hypothetical protein
MNRFQSVALLLLVVFAGLTSGRARAHEATLGVIEFREVRQGAYIGMWISEPEIGAAKVVLRFPPHCYLNLPELNCGDKGLVGSISISNLGTKVSAVLLKLLPLSGEPKSYTITAAQPVVTVLAAGAPTLETWTEVGKTYINYGIDHILLGADHLLFVLGLIWIVGAGWPLVKTITSFTVGHSLSLAAAAFVIIKVPEQPLNACIALSIVFIAVEMVKQYRGETGLSARYPWAVSFGFGLVHGIGFASALAGLGLERSLLPPALFFFNIGVEIGQLAFVLLVLSLIWAHRHLKAVVTGWGDLVPAYVIGSVATFWFFGRFIRIVAFP